MSKESSSYWNFPFVFPFLIQRFNAKDSWKPNHDGEDAELLCD